ncbi:hypothetical protein MMC21_001935 [Puttea exsequens]|nr:hypothetical protein [Puttea exsequens]
MAGILSRYSYALDYQIDDDGKLPVVQHARVYAITDRFSIQQLKDLAQQKFSAALKDLKTLDIDVFVTAVKVIYTSTLRSDHGLRDSVKGTLVKFKQELRDSD